MIDLSQYDEKLSSWRNRWKIEEMWLFGSALRDDFRPDSDLDVMVSISPKAKWDLLDMVAMQIELEEIVGRKVDLVERCAIERMENWIFRDEVLGTAEPLIAIV